MTPCLKNIIISVYYRATNSLDFSLSHSFSNGKSRMCSFRVCSMVLQNCFCRSEMNGVSSTIRKIASMLILGSIRFNALLQSVFSKEEIKSKQLIFLPLTLMLERGIEKVRKSRSGCLSMVSRMMASSAWGYRQLPQSYTGAMAISSVVILYRKLQFPLCRSQFPISASIMNNSPNAAVAIQVEKLSDPPWPA